MTKAEKERLDRLHRMPCIVCGYFPVAVHHCVNQEHRKRDHMRTLPMCEFHHVGAFSIHKNRKSFRARYGHEEELLAKVNNLLAEMPGGKNA